MHYSNSSFSEFRNKSLNIEKMCKILNRRGYKPRENSHPLDKTLKIVTTSWLFFHWLSELL
jgi:hypothetical protein